VPKEEAEKEKEEIAKSCWTFFLISIQILREQTIAFFLLFCIRKRTRCREGKKRQMQMYVERIGTLVSKKIAIANQIQELKK